jgi:hypothetical protein
VRAAALLLFALACFLVGPRALAQPRPEVKAWISADTIAVGETVDITLQATSADAMPGDAQLGRLPAGLRSMGSNSAPSTSISIINGRRTDRRGLSTTWRLRAERPGSYTVGPPSIQIGTTRFRTQPITITVVDAGKAPAQRPRNPLGGGSPFDPFRGLFDFDNQDPFALQNEPTIPVDPKLAMDAPRDATMFLHATIDKTNVVVGEQVTFSVLLYEDASAREAEYNDVHEAPASDFVKRSLLDTNEPAKSIGNASIGGRLWTVKLVRKSALFPLKAGDLEIGAMALAVVSPHNGASAQRTTENLRVHVTEPPLAGRPPGYAVGDVGRFRLAATVAPRTVERGGAVGVTVELSGTGNLPSTLTPPQRTGIEWLEPQVREKIGAVAGDELGGQRTFAFVVRAQREGDIDLGELALPYWDPKKNDYGVAKVALGSLRVTPGATPAAASEGPPDPLPGLPAIRATRGAVRAAGRHVTDSPLLWLGLAAPTLAFAFAAAAREGAARLRARRAAGSTSPRSELKARLTALDKAIASGDGGAIDGAAARALEAATVAHAGVNVRAAATSEIAALLTKNGVPAETAREVEELLRASEAARFSAGSADVSAARERADRARRAIAQMERA